MLSEKIIFSVLYEKGKNKKEKYIPIMYEKGKNFRKLMDDENFLEFDTEKEAFKYIEDIVRNSIQLKILGK